MCQVLVQELRIEHEAAMGRHSATVGQGASQLDMASTALLAKFVAAQLQRDGRRGEAAEVTRA